MITRFFPVASSKILLESSGVWRMHTFCRLAPGTSRKWELKERVQIHPMIRNEGGAQTYAISWLCHPVLAFCLTSRTSLSCASRPPCPGVDLPRPR